MYKKAFDAAIPVLSLELLYAIHHLLTNVKT